MRLVEITLLAVTGAISLAGCSSSNTSTGQIAPVTDRVRVTPLGSQGYVTLGCTNIQVSFPIGAVKAPTTFVISNVQSEAELIAPLPAGRIFVGGLNFTGAALNSETTISFLVPTALNVASGTGVQVFFADPSITPAQFRPVLDSSGNAVFSVVQNRRIPFATRLLGQFVFTTVP